MTLKICKIIKLTNVKDCIKVSPLSFLLKIAQRFCICTAHISKHSQPWTPVYTRFEGFKWEYRTPAVQSTTVIFCECNKETVFFFYLLLYLLHFTGQDFTAAQRERAQEDFKVLFKGAPPHPPPNYIRNTATAPGSPYSFRIVRGFFYVPQNYQHSRNCETGPPTYRPYPRRLESLTTCRWNYKGSTFSSVI